MSFSTDTITETDRVAAATVYCAAIDGADAETLARTAGHREVMQLAIGMAERLSGLVTRNAEALERLRFASRLV